MEFNLKVKIKAGSRTKTEVYVEPCAINRKKIRFKNGAEISDDGICSCIQDYIFSMIEKIKESNNA